VAEVAEVDDRRDAIVAAEQHVVEVQVAVDDLRRQVRPARRDPLLVAVEHGPHQAAAPRVLDVLQDRTELERVGEVPQQLAARGRVKEAAQREHQPRMRRAVVVESIERQLRAAVAPVAALEQADEVRAVGTVDRARREQAGHREVGIHPRDVRQRRRLEVERRRILAEVGDLEHALAAGARHEEGLVALAAEVGRLPNQSEQLGRDPGHLVGAEARGRRLQDRGHAAPP
jgi:hypothetical protein